MVTDGKHRATKPERAPLEWELFGPILGLVAVFAVLLVAAWFAR